MKPNIKSNFQSTYHKDGSVSYWNVFTQQWERSHYIGDEILSTFSHSEVDKYKRLKRLN